MLKCCEVTRLAASGEIREAGLLRRLEFRLHLMMCRHCRNYVKQVRMVGAAARRIFGSCDADPRAVERLEAEILESVREGRRAEGKDGSDTPAGG